MKLPAIKRARAIEAPAAGSVGTVRTTVAVRTSISARRRSFMEASFNDTAKARARARAGRKGERQVSAMKRRREAFSSSI